MKLLVQCPYLESGFREPQLRHTVIVSRDSPDNFLKLARRLHPDSESAYLTYEEMRIYFRLSAYHRKCLKLQFWYNYTKSKFYLL